MTHSCLSASIPRTSIDAIVERVARLFVYSAVVILIVTGVAKLISFEGHAKLLRMTDPVFPFVSNSGLLLITGTLELAVAFVAVKITDVEKKLAVIAGLSALFFLYRVGVWWMNAAQPCKCLGTVMTWLPVSSSTIEYFMKAALAYLVVNSFGLWLLWRRLHIRRT